MSSAQSSYFPFAPTNLRVNEKGTFKDQILNKGEKRVNLFSEPE